MAVGAGVGSFLDGALQLMPSLETFIGITVPPVVPELVSKSELLSSGDSASI